MSQIANETPREIIPRALRRSLGIIVLFGTVGLTSCLATPWF